MMPVARAPPAKARRIDSKRKDIRIERDEVTVVVALHRRRERGECANGGEDDGDRRHDAIPAAEGASHEIDVALDF
jgi:hypothetical protein